MLMAAVVLALALTVPGLLLLAAFRRDVPRSAVGALEHLGLAVALSFGVLILVGGVLGHFGLYRFASTGAPIVESVLLGFAVVCGGLAWRSRVRARRLAAPAAGGN